MVLKQNMSTQASSMEQCIIDIGYWCANQLTINSFHSIEDVDFTEVWRTPEFLHEYYPQRPNQLSNPFYDGSIQSNEDDQPTDLLALGKQLISKLRMRRQRRVEQLDQDDIIPLLTGRIIITEIWASDSCGASGPETNDFFDDDDVPPWDTWIDVIEVPGLVDRPKRYKTVFLLSWVPEEIANMVDDGIHVMPTCPVEWFYGSQSEEPLSTHIINEQWSEVQLLFGSPSIIEEPRIVFRNPW